jgi:transcriptional regulator with XRE-family HTH domain
VYSLSHDYVKYARVTRLPRLKALRERRALSQAELAEKAGITRATLSRLEGGAERPYPSTIRKIAAALGVEPGDLMDTDRPGGH